MATFGTGIYDNSSFYYGGGSWLPPKIPNEVKETVLTASPSIVSLDEIKADLKIEFNDEDDYITDLITLAQAHIEQWCGVSMNERTVQAVVSNVEGNIEIPFGPIISITTVNDEAGNDLTVSFKASGIAFQWIVSPNIPYIKLVYQAGYAPENLPLDLKKAVKQEVAFRYTHRIPITNSRANVNPGICDEAIHYANPFRRNKFI